VEAHESVLAGIVRSVAPTADRDAAEDLMQEARVALIQHIRAYDTSQSAAQLHTFAYRACRRAVAEEWIRATVGLTIDVTAVLRVKQVLATVEGDIEGAWMIISTADGHRRMSRETFMAVLDALRGAESLDSVVGDEDGVTLAETIPDPESDFATVTDRRDLARWLLTQIKPSHAYALRAFYGIGMERIPDEELCVELGIQRRAVSTLRSRGVERARTVAASFDIAA
jgi:RNA polymerase primary sigma factor